MPISPKKIAKVIGENLVISITLFGGFEGTGGWRWTTYWKKVLANRFKWWQILKTKKSYSGFYKHSLMLTKCILMQFCQHFPFNRRLWFGYNVWYILLTWNYYIMLVQILLITHRAWECLFWLCYSHIKLFIIIIAYWIIHI